MQTVPLPSPVAAVRSFNRFYTRQIGVLGEGLLRSPFSLTEARVMFELAARPGRTAAWLRKELGLDAGYLSRILGVFRKRGLVVRARSAQDRREGLLSQVGSMLERVPAPRRDNLVAAMRQIQVAFAAPEAVEGPFLVRDHQPGDLGWVVHRHGALYAREYGYDEQFEALVAEIVAAFGKRHDPKRERCWIAERAGENLGSVLLVRKSQTVAKLRLLLVEPSARGLGIGGALVSECVRFARGAGYRKITLWTQSELRAARRLYEQAGFQLAGEKPHHSFGRDLVGETWDLRL